MGGRGGSSGLVRTRTTPQPQITPAPQPQTTPIPPQMQQIQQAQQPAQTGPIQNQVPDDNNTPVAPDPVKQLQGMGDSQLAQLYTQSKTAKLPNHLNDADDATQKFVFTAGINGKPTVLDQAEFNQFMKDNGISQREILSRSIRQSDLNTSAGSKAKLTPQQIVDMLKYGRLTYIGGKRGGQAYGAGAYFDMNGGGSTGYGNGATMTAVLNPATARPISDTRLPSLARAFDQAHPQFARATGGYNGRNMSIYALVLGYNVITESNGGPGRYHNIIDRAAMVMLK